MPVPASLARLASLPLAMAAAFTALCVYPHELPPARHPDVLAVVLAVAVRFPTEENDPADD